MIYIIFIVLIAPCLYTLSFAKYSWNIKNKTAAAGALLIAAASVLSSLYMVFIKFS